MFEAEAWWAMWPIAIFSFGWSLMVPVVTLMVLDLVPERRGMASSMQACIGSLANGLVAGVIAPLVEGIELSEESMPHMSVREGKVGGGPTRLCRMSFTGDRGFEVNVPADYGQSVGEALWAEGQKHDACAYGTEAMQVLRAEKGYIIVGQDTDGTVSPHDLGMSSLVNDKKPDFIGKRGLKRQDLQRPDRKQLVGLSIADGDRKPLPEGAHLVDDADAPTPVPMMAASLIAVLNTRLRPKVSKSPTVAWKAPP